MTNTNACKAGGALPARPEMAEARTCSGVSGFVEGQTERNGSDFASRCAGALSAGHAERALLAIEGESYARAYLDRLNAGTAQPGELSALLTFLGAEMMHGACRALEKALQGARHG